MKYMNIYVNWDKAGVPYQYGSGFAAKQVTKKLMDCKASWILNFS